MTPPKTPAQGGEKSEIEKALDRTPGPHRTNSAPTSQGGETEPWFTPKDCPVRGCEMVVDHQHGIWPPPAPQTEHVKLAEHVKPIYDATPPSGPTPHQPDTSEQTASHLKRSRAVITDKIADLESELAMLFKSRDEMDEVIAGLEAGDIVAEEMK